MILWSQISIISVPTHAYSVWIYCYKRPNYDFCILQSSIATVLRWVGQTMAIFVKFFFHARLSVNYLFLLKQLLFSHC